ncbi:MAG: DUF6088 family protein [Clostridia bacterium]
MNYNEIVYEYINNCNLDEPLFLEEIKQYVINNYKNDEINILKNINVIINRMCKNDNLKQFYKGIYYKPVKNIFGEMPLDKNKVIIKKYIKDENGYIKGYITGAKLFNQLGLTTQVPNIINIVTNECKNYNEYKNEKLGVIIRQPKIKINNDNYKYLQLFDIIYNKDQINIEVDNEDEIIYNFIEENKLDFEKIIKYARETKNKKVLEKLYILAR